MKLSIDTLAILKNFSAINSGILFREGNMISTISPQKNILADALIQETFTNTFAIYDLNNFLSVLTLFKEGAELEFDDKNVYIKGLGGRSKIKYRFADASMIVAAPEKRPNLSDIDVQFKLTEEDFQWILKTANVLSSPHIAIECDGEDVSITAFDSNDDSAHSNSLLLSGVTGSHPYKLIFKTENLKMMPGTYNVEISAKGISKFVGETNNLAYYVTLEMNSIYNKNTGI